MARESLKTARWRRNTRRGSPKAGEDSTIVAVGIEEHIIKPHSTRWSARVTRQSNALTLENGVFTKRSPRQIALSLKRSAERSRRRKSTPFRSAMSMLNFYINRMGTQLSGTRRKVLERAKSDLRELFGKSD
jgi:hypothetical protein